MTLSLATKLKQFSNSPALSNPATSQAFLARQPGVAAAFGAGFLAPAVDAANERQQRLEFLLALDRAERDNRRLDLQDEAAARRSTIDAFTLQRLQRENDPEFIAEQQRLANEDRNIRNENISSQQAARDNRDRRQEEQFNRLEAQQKLLLEVISSQGIDIPGANTSPTSMLDISPQQEQTLLEAGIPVDGITTQEQLDEALNRASNPAQIDSGEVDEIDQLQLDVIGGA